MSSRIDIGPDGGPFISINENNGDIELKDNAGNVVATYDDSLGVWDYASKDLNSLGQLELTDTTSDPSANGEFQRNGSDVKLHTGGSLRNLSVDSLTIAGNSVALGGSTGIDHADLATAPASAHHQEPTAGTAITDEGTNQFGLDTSTSVSFPNGIDSLPAPTNDNDATRKSYVDAIEQGLDIKDSVRAATDGANVNLGSSTDPNPIDGVTLADGDRVLLKDQSTGSENGLYEAVTATDPTTWTRTNDADEDDEVTAGLFVFVEEGSVNLNRGFVLTTNDPITVGSDSLTFTQFSGAGQVTAGTLLTKSGDTLNVSESDIDHDNIDQTTVNASDHHQEPTTGTGITDESTNQFGIADNGVDTTQIATAAVTDTELGVDAFSYSPGMTEFEDGLSNEEIDRIVLQSGETLVVERIEFRQKGGGSSTSASIDVRDTTAATTVGSQNLGGTTKDPGSSGSGNTVIVRANNSTGSLINAAPRVQGYIVGV
jgi:hypothetical protein